MQGGTYSKIINFDYQINGNLSDLQILKIDYFILSVLAYNFLCGNIDFVNINDFVDNDVLNELECNLAQIHNRMFCNVCLGNIQIDEKTDIKNIQDIEKLKQRFVQINPVLVEKLSNQDIAKSIYNSYYAKVKITSNGLETLSHIKDKIKEKIKSKTFLYNLKKSLSYIYANKIMIGFGLTIILALSINIFDIKISDTISKIPFVSSIIDAEFLAQFESVDENDEDYNALKESIENKEISNIGNSEYTTLKTNLLGSQEDVQPSVQPSITTEPTENTGTLNTDNDYIQQSLNIEFNNFRKESRDVKVLRIDDNQSIFRLTLIDGKTIFFYGKKINGKYKFEKISQLAAKRLLKDK